MNSLRKAIASELLYSSPSPRKCQFLLHSIASLQHQQCSQFSTSNSTPRKTGLLKKQEKPSSVPKNPKTNQPQQSSPISSEMGQLQKEREMEKPISNWPKKDPSQILKENEMEIMNREIQWKSIIADSVQKKSPSPASAEEREEEREIEIPMADWPRPTEIPWQAKVANSVNLIGRVEIPVQLQASPGGKYWAGTIISQQHVDEENTVTSSSSDSPPFWIPIIFEGDLAHIAACHLKEKDRVYIDGQLTADPPPFTMSHGQANVQVMVRSVNFVHGSSQLKKSIAPFRKEERTTDHSVSEIKDGDPILNSWRDILKNPKQWRDNRESKLNGRVKPKYPDFKHKDSGVGLWLNTAPKWVLSELEGLEFDGQIQSMKQVKEGKEEDSWKNLVENPDRWWDNRADKFNKKSPDFKHKDTGEGLWVSDSPAWAQSKLPPLRVGKRNSVAS